MQQRVGKWKWRTTFGMHFCRYSGESGPSCLVTISYCYCLPLHGLSWHWDNGGAQRFKLVRSQGTPRTINKCILVLMIIVTGCPMNLSSYQGAGHGCGRRGQHRAHAQYMPAGARYARPWSGSPARCRDLASEDSCEASLCHQQVDSMTLNKALHSFVSQLLYLRNDNIPSLPA